MLESKTSRMFEQNVLVNRLGSGKNEGEGLRPNAYTEALCM